MLNEENTQIYVEEKNLQLIFKSAFTDGITDSSSWLLSLLESLVLSLLFTQPLAIYLLTWLKLCAFTNNLKLDYGVGNLFQLVIVLFRCRSQNEDLAGPDPSGPEVQCRRVFASDVPGRQLDIYGFYGNPELFVIDEDGSQAGARSRADSEANMLGEELMDQQRGLLVPSASEEPGSEELSVSIEVGSKEDEVSMTENMQGIPIKIMVGHDNEAEEERGNESRLLTPNSDDGVVSERIGFHRARQSIQEFAKTESESDVG